MRAAAVFVLLASVSCGPSDSGGCEVDDDCGGADVCARNGDCLPASNVRAVRITWTIRGQPASVTTCAQSPSLYLMFLGFAPNDFYGYEPVPCDAGLFVVDKLPTRYGSVEIGARGSFQMEKVFDSSGNASFDLMP